MTLLLTAAGGALGAVARYLVDFWVVSRGINRIPLGTLAVNVSGSLGLGLLVGFLGGAEAVVGAGTGGAEAGWIMTFVGAGFLAAYTTFSTWMFEAARLVQRGALRAAAIHMLGTVILGVAAAAAGIVAGAALAGL